jgi:hypothetical protein
MAKLIVTMDIGSGRTIAFGLPDYQVTYFGIPQAPAGAVDPKLVSRAGYTYIKKGLGAADDSAGTSVTVGEARWYAPPRTGGKIAGRKIIVPSKKTTSKGNIMMVTMRIPSVAAVMPIVDWVWGWAAATRPGYVQLESGVRYPIRNYTVADVNPGNAGGATPPAP